MEDKTYWHEGEPMTLKQEQDGSWKPATPEPYHSTWKDRIACFFGYHYWSWNLMQEGDTFIMDDEIPGEAICMCCNQMYKKR